MFSFLLSAKKSPVDIMEVCNP